MVPLAVTAGISLFIVLDKQQDLTQQRSLEATRLAATAIELELQRSTDVAKALALSPMLAEQQLARFRELIERVMPLMPGWVGLTLSDASENEVLTVGTAGNLQGVDHKSFLATQATETPLVGSLDTSPTGVKVIPLRIPVLQNGRLRFILTIAINPDTFTSVLQTRKLPEGWVTSVFDQQGIRVARSQDAKATVGLPAAPSAKILLQDPSPEGIGRTLSVEGLDVYTAFSRLADTGWVVATGIPTKSVRDEALKSLALYGGGLLVSLMAAIVAALYFTRRIRRPIEQLHEASRAIGTRQLPPIVHGDIIEINELGKALQEAAQARETIESHNDELLRRLQISQATLAQQVTDLETKQALNYRLLELETQEQQLLAILDALCTIHGANQGIVSLSTGEQPLRICVSKGLSTVAVAQLQGVSPGEGACGAAVSDRRRVIIEDTETDPRFLKYRALSRQEGFRAVHSTPLCSNRHGVLGVLTVQLPTPRPPTEREVRFADQCAWLATLFIERAIARAEAARIADANAHLQEALNSSVVPYMMFASVQPHDANTNLQLTFANPAASEWFGFETGVSLAALPEGRMGSAFSQTLQGLCLKVLEEGTETALEIQVDALLPPRWLHIVAGPYRQGVSLWFVDVSAAKALEVTLREADARKDRYLAVLAHELRTPLAPIRQAAAILASTNTDDRQKARSLAVIDRQAAHMGHLLNDLLDVSRIAFGKISLHKEQVSLNSAVARAAEEMAASVADKAQKLTLDLCPEDTLVEADPTRLEQILTNLLQNASKYTAVGGDVRVTTLICPSGAEVLIEDTGIGIDTAHLCSIFDLFSEVEPNKGQTSDGLGIGLYLSRELARLQGGDIWAHSEGLGKGSRFTIQLPTAELSVAPMPALTVNDRGRESRRVLVADDQVDIASTLTELLELEGHQVRTAANGLEALSMAEQKLPQVALLDIGMPGLTGYEVASAIRALPAGDQAVLIAFSGWGQIQDVQKALDAGFDFHMTKPADLDELLRLVAQGTRATP